MAPYLSMLRNSYLNQLKAGRFALRHLKLAEEILDAIHYCQPIPLLSERYPGFDQSEAYKVSAAMCARRLENTNFCPIGRKIGFTNTKIWSEYNVSEPNWGYLWNLSTFQPPKSRVVTLNERIMALQPRIEPEIILCLKKRPNSSMTEIEALSCVEWISHGFEVVQSVYKDWKFTAPDTTAANALHRSLFLGGLRYMHKNDIETFSAQLETFDINLYKQRELVDIGKGGNVLGGPAKALLHLCRMLESQTLHPQLMAGEIISTGTLTKAMPISIGDEWITKPKGINLPSMSVKVEDAALREKQSTEKFRRVSV